MPLSSRLSYSLENSCGTKGSPYLCSPDLSWKTEIMSVIAYIFLLSCDEIKSHMMKLSLALAESVVQPAAFDKRCVLARA